MTDAELFETLKGKTLLRIEGSVGDSELIFYATKGATYKLYHKQDCCESVILEDICGDLNDLIGEELLEAEVVTNSEENPPGAKPEWQDDSFTWTFYKLRTMKGGVTIRWYGSSNGYYSEAVSCVMEQLDATENFKRSVINASEEE